MIWRRAGSLSRRPWGRRGYATVPPAPYDVLFCGSDAFACEAVAAIAHRPDLYRSLHVLTPRMYSMPGARNVCVYRL